MKIISIPLLVAGIILAVLAGQMAGQHLGNMETSPYWDEAPRMVASACVSFGFVGMIGGMIYHNFSPDSHYWYGMTVTLLSACGIGTGTGWHVSTFHYDEKFGAFLFDSTIGSMTLLVVGMGMAGLIMREFREKDLF